MSIHEAPLIRIIVPFIIGILFQLEFAVEISFLLTIGLSFLVAFIILFLSKLNLSVSLQPIMGGLTMLIIVCVGSILVYVSGERNNQLHFSHFLKNSDYAIAKVKEPINEKENSFGSVIEINRIGENKTEGNSIVYFEKDKKVQELSIGDFILVKTNFNEIAEPKNPDEFNYKLFLESKRITHQTFLKKSEWKLLEKGDKSLLYYSNKLRNRLLSILKKSGVEQGQFGVASALLLGSKDDLTYGQKKSFAIAGAMHVLAVSGLHVGILFLVLNAVLFFLNKSQRARVIKATILIAFLWFYALLTGLSPSVLRAATMFSFVVIGQTINRKTNIYNTLAASALLLLLLNPFLINEVGFQLSYLAVLGIVYFQPKIYSHVYTKWWLLDKIWSITSVSIAAQIATLPLTLYYFHQFPTYFLLANIVVIPAATIILSLGILILILSPFTIIAAALGWILNEFIWYLNSFIELFHYLPFSVMNGVSISRLEVLLLTGIIILLSISISTKKVKWLNRALLVLLFSVGLDLVEDYNLIHSDRICVYAVQKEKAMDFIHGKNNYFVASNGLINDEKKIGFHVQPNWNRLDLENTESTLWANHNVSWNNILDQKQNFYYYKGKRIAVISNDTFINSNGSIKVDYVIISQNPVIKIKDLVSHFDFKTLLIDASNFSWKANKFEIEADEFNLDVFNLSKTGAYEEILE